MAQVIECLPSKYQALSSNPSTFKKAYIGKDVGNIPHCWWNVNYSLQLWKLLKKLKLELPHDSAIQLLGTYLNKSKLAQTRDNCTSMLIAALFIIAKSWNQPK
jgi:hypothetical protein